MIINNYTEEKITKIIEWMKKNLFSIKTTRYHKFVFKAGQFVRLGLTENNYPPLWRPYSIVSAPHEEEFEFYFKVLKNGKFTPILSKLYQGNKIYIENRSFGYLTINSFSSGGTLWLIAASTGLSAYLSILRDKRTWEKFNRIILVHGVQRKEGFAYKDEILLFYKNEKQKFIYIPIVTKQKGKKISNLFFNNSLEILAGQKLNPSDSKVMLCGNYNMIRNSRKILYNRGFFVGKGGNYGNLLVENY